MARSMVQSTGQSMSQSCDPSLNSLVRPSVNGMTTSQDTRIVVGVDGSEGSLKALRWALAQAALTGSEVECVYAWDYPAYWSAGIGWVPPDDMAMPDQSAEQLLKEAVAKVTGSGPAVPVRLRPMQGGPTRALMEAADGAALLVVGNRGHGAFTELLLGSVSLQAATHAPCPVVVVHGV